MTLKNNIYHNNVKVGEFDATGDTAHDTKMVLAVLCAKGLDVQSSRVESMHRTAQAFADGSKLIYDELTASPAKIFLILPFVANSAFAAELYLKLLLQKHGIHAKGHELLKLYQLLPSEGIEKIEKAASEYASSLKSNRQLNFQDCLNELNMAFVEWRYFYETPQTSAVNIEHAVFTLHVLKEACIE